MSYKLKSRKFLVFIIWVVIGLYMIFTQQSMTEFLPNFMIISAIYIGGNAAQHIAYDMRNKKE